MIVLSKWDPFYNDFKMLDLISYFFRYFSRISSQLFVTGMEIISKISQLRCQLYNVHPKLPACVKYCMWYSSTTTSPWYQGQWPVKDWTCTCDCVIVTAAHTYFINISYIEGVLVLLCAKKKPLEEFRLCYWPILLRLCCYSSVTFVWTSPPIMAWGVRSYKLYIHNYCFVQIP